MSGMRTAAIGFPVLLVAFWFTGVYFGITDKLGAHPAAALVSFALLLAPYWFFGFGLAEELKRRLTRPVTRIAASTVFIVPIWFSPFHAEILIYCCAPNCCSRSWDSRCCLNLCARVGPITAHCWQSP